MSDSMTQDAELEVLSIDPCVRQNWSGRSATIEFRTAGFKLSSVTSTYVFLALAFPLTSNIVVGVQQGHKQAAHLAASHLAEWGLAKWVGAPWWRNNDSSNGC